MINEIFFDKFKIENIEHDKNKVLIILKSTALAAKCTCCGAKTTKVHSKYKRQILDLPILDKYTRLSIITRRFSASTLIAKERFFQKNLKDLYQDIKG